MNFENDKKIFLIIGMAGSGKTTFSQRLYSWISEYTSKECKSKQKSVIDSETGLNKYIYSINIDPAVYNSKMPLNEDIRDSLDIQEVMDKYNLGPNGAIVTSLNLFLLKSDLMIERITEKSPNYVIIDTPGQIEAFTWSSPGFVLVESLKSLKDYQITILYTIDSEMCAKQAVFISNMVYAASLACRFNCETKLIFNKADLVSDKNKLINWLDDYNLFRESLDENEMHTPMLSSLALYFEEFYNHLKNCFISSSTGSGKQDFFDLVGIAKKEENDIQKEEKKNLKENDQSMDKDKEETLTMIEKLKNLDIERKNKDEK